MSHIFLSSLYEEGMSTRGVTGLLSQALIKCKYGSKAISIGLVLESPILCVLLAEPVEARKQERGHGEGYGTRR